jgi:transcriptional regulator with XRE-family HTH domain
MTFTRRAITAPDTLGERLRQLREEAGWTIEEVGQRITVAPKYIAAIESGRYQDLPGLVYARNFVKLYVELVKLEPLAAAACAFYRCLGFSDSCRSVYWLAIV